MSRKSKSKRQDDDELDDLVNAALKNKKSLALDDDDAPAYQTKKQVNLFALLGDDDGNDSPEETPAPKKKSKDESLKTEKSSKESRKSKSHVEEKPVEVIDEDGETKKKKKKSTKSFNFEIEEEAPIPVKVKEKGHKAVGKLKEKYANQDSMDESMDEQKHKELASSPVDLEFEGWIKEDRKAKERKLRHKSKAYIPTHPDTPEPQERNYDIDTPDTDADNREVVQTKSEVSEEEVGPTPALNAQQKKKKRKDRRVKTEQREKTTQPATDIKAALAQKSDEEELVEEMEEMHISKPSTPAAPVIKKTYAEDDDEVKKFNEDGTFVSTTDHLTITGTLISDETSRDIMIDKFSLAAWGNQLIKDTTLKLVHGRRYGLLGANGCGKSTFLKALGSREVPIQKSIDVYLLDKEFDPTDLTAIEAVVDIVKTEKEALEAEQEELLGRPGGHEDPRFEIISERINELDLDSAERRAKDVLFGLGFTPEMQAMTTKEFSGGWRMRISLARALFVKPTLLLLDDPTNHLDLASCVWLEEYLKQYKHTILFVSHSQDFLNGVCTDIIHMHNKRLDYYSGDYDTFVTVKEQRDESLAKRVKADEKMKKKMQETVAKLGQKVAVQAKQKEKALAKKNEKFEALKDEVVVEKEVKIHFPECGRGLPPPVLQFREVSFGYPGRQELFNDVSFGIDLDSRIALVGPNGAGKSTLMKLMAGQLQPTKGEVKRHHHLRIARFHQHLTDQLDLRLTPVQFLVSEFKSEDGTAVYKDQEMRNILGRFGLTGKSQVIPMHQLSDGQRRRVVFAWLSLTTPHMLFLDEPTNFLDIETIDALADAINEFDGGVILISHDFRLIDQVAKEIWVVEEGVEIWEGTIQDLKEDYRERVIVPEEF